MADAPVGVSSSVAFAQASKAWGVTVKINADAFLNILSRMKKPLIVKSTCGVWSKKFEYLASYKGLTFYTESKEALTLPPKAEIINAEKISVAE